MIAHLSYAPAQLSVKPSRDTETMVRNTANKTPLAATAIADEIIADDIVAPDTLVLSHNKIMSTMHPGTAPYILNEGITASHSRPISIGRRCPALPDADLAYHLERHPLQASDADDRHAYSLVAIQGKAPGDIRLFPDSSHKASPLQAVLTRAVKDIGTSQNQLLFMVRPRWMSEREFNYLDAEGQQVACEERIEVDGQEEEGYQLVFTRPVRRSARDACVAVWCLRVWRERLEDGRRTPNQEEVHLKERLRQGMSALFLVMECVGIAWEGTSLIPRFLV